MTPMTNDPARHAIDGATRAVVARSRSSISAIGSYAPAPEAADP